MAKLLVLLCFTALVVAVLARNKRQEIIHSGPLNAVGHHGTNAMEGRPALFNRYLHHRPAHRMMGGHGRQHGSHGALTHHQGGHGRPHARAGPVAQRGGMHRLAMALLKAPEHAIGRLPHHRMMETLRDELRRYQMAGRGQGPRRRGHVQGRGRHPGFQEIGRRSRRPHRAGGSNVRGHGRHHLGNDPRGHSRLMGGHHAVHLGHGQGGRGHGMGPRYGVL